MQKVTDFHSHILPKLDDGSKSTEESVEMLRRLASQGVGRVVASPHFYANDQSVEEFLMRRGDSFEALKPLLGKDMPQVVLGAELRYYEGVSRLEGLEKLCIQGSELLLLEMPERSWSEYVQRELTDLACRGGLRLVIAHVERCLPFQKPAVTERLAADGVLMQMNAEAFKGFGAKRKAIKLLRQGAVQFIGSDSHNLTDRAPNMDVALDALKKKLGVDFVMELVSFGNGFFADSL